MEGYTANTWVPTDKGKRWGRISVWLHDNNAWIFTGVVGDTRRRKAEDALLLKTAESFHSLNKKQREQARPLQIRLMIADEQTNYAELAKRSALSSHAVDRLRLLNRHYPGGEPVAGQMLKVVE